MTKREILVGVTGGIAAYKTADLVSKLAQSGAAVSVVMTARRHEVHRRTDVRRAFRSQRRHGLVRPTVSAGRTH